MSFFEFDVHNIVYDLIFRGYPTEDRTGVGTRSTFGSQLRIDLTEGFPAVTCKQLMFNAVKSELLWFLEGSTDERRLAEIHYSKPREELIGKRTIWTANADNQGVAKGHHNSLVYKQLGPVYGAQWRGTYDVRAPDQIKNVIKSIKEDPYSRRHIIDAWNPSLINKMALPPCHPWVQFYVRGGELSCMFYMRSQDIFLGGPFNWASYALLTHMIAQVCGLTAKEIVVNYGDCHIYENHIEQAELMISREPLPLPKLWLNPEITDIFDFKMEDIKLENYQHHPAIPAPMAV